jgi:hypothetical protein
MRRYVIVGLIAILASFTLVITVAAQSGHFLTSGGNTVTCTDIGTQLQCSGKVSGLGGTTFEIRLVASGEASVVCTNPGGNIAPGQNFTFTASGTTGTQTTPRNGQFSFTVTTAAPAAPANSCPNPGWTATVSDVDFSGAATLSLFEDNTLVDQVSVSLI